MQIFSLIGSGTAANILNFVVLTAALSVYNSGVYCNSRMLYGLAAQGGRAEGADVGGPPGRAGAVDPGLGADHLPLRGSSAYGMYCRTRRWSC
ncbi:hypothetical protein ACG3RN_27880 [Pseudomonas aeruginosa]